MAFKLVFTLVVCVLVGMISGCATHSSFPPRTDKASVDSRERRFKVRVISNLIYIERENQKPLHGDLYLPQGKGPFPGVLVVHGGSWNAGSRSDMTGISQTLARHGFVAFNIEYRLAPSFRFPAQVHDLRAAIRWMRTHAERYGIQASEIGGFGYSAGAHLVALVALASFEDIGLESNFENERVSSELRAAVLGGTPADLTKTPDSEAVTTLLGTTWAKNPDLFRKASPVFHVSPDDPPLFLYHGRNDQIVDVERSRELSEALRSADVATELYLLPFLGHILTFIFDGGAVAKAIDFLDFHLREHTHTSGSGLAL